MSSVITVALATSALVKLSDRDSGRESTAADLENYIIRAGHSIELWTAVNAHFIFGLLSLCGAVGLRCWSLYLERGDPLAMASCMMMGSGTLLALSLGLPRVGGQGGLLGLLRRYATLICRKAFNPRAPAPLLFMSVLLVACSAIVTVREILAFVVPRLPA